MKSPLKSTLAPIATSVVAVLLAMSNASAQSLYWDANGTGAVGNPPTAGVGGTGGVWNNSNLLWWNGTSYVAWNGGLADFRVAASGATIAASTVVNVSGINVLVTSTIAAGTGGSLNLTGTPTFNVANTGSLTISAPITGTGGFTKTGAGYLTLSGANTLSGALVIDGGMVRVSSSTNLGSLSSGTVASGAQFRQDAGTSNIAFTISGNGIFTNPGTFGALRGDGANVVFNGDVTLAGNSRISQGIFNGRITGNYALEIGAANGTGLQNTTTTTLTNANNDYTGDTTILVGNATAGLVNQYSTTVRVGSANGAIANGVGKGNLIIQGGQTTTNLANVGTLDLYGNNETVNGLSHSGIAANARISNSVVATTSQLSVGDADANGDFGGVISNGVGTVAFEKIGSGVQILSGSNSYTGATTVTAGTLLINGNQTSASGNVTVATGATLGGVGTIGGATVVNGDLAAGNNGVGLLTFGNGLTLSSSAESLFQINGLTRATDFDAINITGALAYDGLLTLDFGFEAEIGQTFDLFDFSSQSGNFAGLNFLNSGYNGTFDAATGVLTLTAVPEPSVTALLLGAGLLVVVTLRRRHLKTN